MPFGGLLGSAGIHVRRHIHGFSQSAPTLYSGGLYGLKVAVAHVVSASEGSRGKIKLEKFPPGLKIKGVFKGMLVIQQKIPLLKFRGMF